MECVCFASCRKWTANVLPCVILAPLQHGLSDLCQTQKKKRLFQMDLSGNEARLDMRATTAAKPHGDFKLCLELHAETSAQGG